MTQQNNIINWNKMGSFLAIPHEILKLNKVNGKVFSFQSKGLYCYLSKYQHNIGKDAVEVSQESLSKRFGVSRKTISGWLDNLIALSLLEKLPTINGASSQYRVLDIEQDQTALPSDKEFQGANSRKESKYHYVHENKTLLDKYKDRWGVESDKYKGLKKLVDVKCFANEVFSGKELEEYLKVVSGVVVNPVSHFSDKGFEPTVEVDNDSLLKNQEKENNSPIVEDNSKPSAKEQEKSSVESYESFIRRLTREVNNWPTKDSCSDMSKHMNHIKQVFRERGLGIVHSVLSKNEYAVNGELVEVTPLIKVAVIKSLLENLNSDNRQEFTDRELLETSVSGLKNITPTEPVYNPEQTSLEKDFEEGNIPF